MAPGEWGILGPAVVWLASATKPIMDRRDALMKLGGIAAVLVARTTLSAGNISAGNLPLPEWVPAPGLRRNVSHNLLADVDPCPARNCSYSGVIGQRAVLEAWCGAAFATAYGRLGAWITTGGGHGDYFGNEVYAFELDTLRWVRLNDPYPGGPASSVDYGEGEYAPGIPLSSHTYQHTQYLPPELGGGPKGSLLLVVSYAAGKLAQGSGRAHVCDLATGRWSRYSVNKATVRVNATSATCFDADRNLYWRVPYGGAEIEYLASDDRSFHKVRAESSGGNNFGVDHVCVRDPLHDLLLVLDWRPRAAAVLWALDIIGAGGGKRDAPEEPTRPARRKGASGTAWTALSVEGSAPGTAAQGMGLEWCPPLRCFVGYPGSNEQFVYKLVPPGANPQHAAWRWETETLAGDPPIGRSKGPHMNYSRFRWAPAIRSFVWADDPRKPVQVWRLRGT
jgi:hypothetical protein